MNSRDAPFVPADFRPANENHTHKHTRTRCRRRPSAPPSAREAASKKEAGARQPRRARSRPASKPSERRASCDAAARAATGTTNSGASMKTRHTLLFEESDDVNHASASSTRAARVRAPASEQDVVARVRQNTGDGVPATESDDHRVHRAHV